VKIFGLFVITFFLSLPLSWALKSKGRLYLNPYPTPSRPSNSLQTNIVSNTCEDYSKSFGNELKFADERLKKRGILNGTEAPIR